MNYKFANCDTVQLAKDYQTPLYVMDEDLILSKIKQIKDCFDNKYTNATTFFASKVFLTKDMLRIIKENNIGIDVVSKGELYGALDMGIDPNKIFFHGNAKNNCEIDYAIKNKVARLVSDSLDEILAINDIAKQNNTTQNILIRISPAVDSHTHKYISTASLDSKFGIPLASLDDVLKVVLSLPNIKLTGFHFHVGSQLLTNESHLKAIKILLDVIKKVKDTFSFDTLDLDFGGGFGIKYTEADEIKPINYYIDPIVNEILDFCKDNNLVIPHLYTEPGRWIVGDAGITLYEVQNVKTIPDVKTYVSVDGGMGDNIRPGLYEAKYDAIVCNKINEPKTEKVAIAGKYCESTDILIEEILLPKTERGDIIAFKSTGAYNYSMASNYNKNAIPAVVMIKDGKPRVSVKRQTFEQLYQNDLGTSN